MTIPYGRQTIDERDVARVVKTLRSPWLTQGPAVLEFEKKLAEVGGAKFAVAVSNGTAALHLAYLAAGLKKGDEVITTPNTFAATANMLLAVGAKPVFCDIRLDTYNLDERQIEKFITKRTKAIVVVDFAGQTAEMNEILRIAKKHKLLLIEDASHSLGASYRGRRVGSLADLTTMSFHPVKAIATGEGGAVLTDNKAFYEKIKLLRTHGIFKDKSGKNVMVALGFNYRMSDIQAALGISQLRKLSRFLRLRRNVVGWYRQSLDGLNEVFLPAEAPRNRSGWHLFVIRAKNSQDRQRLHDFLLQKGIGANFHYPAVYRHPFYRQAGYGKTSLPNEEVYQSTCVTLPCYPTLQKSEVEYVSRSIKSFFRRRGK